MSYEVASGGTGKLTRSTSCGAITMFWVQVPDVTSGDYTNSADNILQVVGINNDYSFQVAGPPIAGTTADQLATTTQSGSVGVVSSGASTSWLHVCMVATPGVGVVTYYRFAGSNSLSSVTNVDTGVQGPASFEMLQAFGTCNHKYLTAWKEWSSPTALTPTQILAESTQNAPIVTTGLVNYLSCDAGHTVGADQSTGALNWTVTATVTYSANEPNMSIGGPTITTQPSATQVAPGATATFTSTATASGGGSLSYQFQLNGSNISGASGGGGSASYTSGALALTDDLGGYSLNWTETGGTSPGTVSSSLALVHVGTWVVAAGTPAYSAASGTSIAPSYSTLPTIQAGDEIVLIVHQKPNSTNPNGGTVTTPSGYTLIGSLTAAGGYSTTIANNTGNTNLFVYSKTGGATGSETGTLTVTIAGGAGTNGMGAAILVLLRPVSGSTVGYALASGSDITAGNVSITCGSDPGETAGDLALQIFGGSSQAILPFSAQAITTTGITYGSVAELVEYGTITGNDVAGYIASAKAQSGTSSAAPVFTATVGGTTTNARGPGLFLRMRAAPTAGGTPVARPRSISDEQPVDMLSRGRWIPVSGIAPSPPPPTRRRAILDEQTADTVVRRPWIPTSGVVPSQAPSARRRAVVDEQSPEVLLRRPWLPVSGAAQAAATPIARRRAVFDESVAPDLILRPGTAAVAAATVAPDSPPLVAYDTSDLESSPAEWPIAKLRAFPGSGPSAPAQVLRAPRPVIGESVADDTIRPRPSPLLAFAPQSPPPLTRARQNADDAQQDDAQRRGASIPASGVAPSNPPQVRSRPVSDEQSPETLLRRPWLPVSGQVPSAPPVLRARPIGDEQSLEPIQRKPWAPDFARVDAPPVTRPRVASEDLAPDQLQRRPWAAPAPAVAVTPLIVRARPLADEAFAPDLLIERELVQAPAAAPSAVPMARPRVLPEEQQTDQLQRRAAGMPATPIVATQPPLARPRTIADEPTAETVPHRAGLPVSAPPPSPPPITRAHQISDEQSPEVLQRKPWSAIFWQVDPPPTARPRPIAEEPFPPEQTFLDLIWRGIRSVAAFFGIAPPPIVSPAPWPRLAAVNFEKRVAVAQEGQPMSSEGYFAEYVKDPADVEDYSIDWHKLLGNGGIALEAGEVVASSVWTIANNNDGSLVVLNQGLSSPYSTIIVSGGNPANDYCDLRCHVTTSGGNFPRQHTRTIRLWIRNR